MMKLSRTDAGKKKGKFQTPFQPRVPGPPGSCYECGRQGHKAKECRSKKNGGRQVVKAALEETSDDASDREPEETRDSGQTRKNGRLMVLIHGMQQKVETMENCNQTEMAQRKQRLFIDSGASSHMMHDHSLFSLYCELNKEVPVRLGNGSVVYAVSIGTVNVSTAYRGKECEFALQNGYHVPDLTNNFPLVSAMARVGNVCTVFDDNGVKIQDKKSCEVLGYGNLIGNVYLLSCNAVLTLNMSQTESAHTREGSERSMLQLWHRRLGHYGVDRLTSAMSKDLIMGMGEIHGDLGHCKGCINGKSVRAPFPKREEITSEKVLDLVHTDVCGPFSTNSAGGAKYFLSLSLTSLVE